MHISCIITPHYFRFFFFDIGQWGAYNLLPGASGLRNGDPLYTLSYVNENGSWTKLTEFVYADGTTNRPPILRDTPPQNYLCESLRIVGFLLFGIVIVLSVTASAWVFVRRKHPVLRASQPCFLYAISIGTVVFASAIVPLSFDEGDGWDEAQLDIACMSIPWLVSLGHIITYSALFAKLWRVHRVLQFTRRKVEIRRVAWPAAILTMLALFILGLWTGLDTLQWERITIYAYTGESIGHCDSEFTGAYAVGLAVLMLIPTIFTGIMAWKTKDVDDAYAESWWTFMLIFVQGELLVVGIPVIFILRSLSTDGKYIGYVILLFALPVSALVILMMPKVLAYARAVRGVQARPRRGTPGNGRVSGLPLSSSPNPNGSDTKSGGSSSQNSAHTPCDGTIP